MPVSYNVGDPFVRSTSRLRKTSRRAIVLTRKKGKSKTSKMSIIKTVNETKWFLAEAAATSLSTTPSMTVLNIVQQGDTGTTRDGNKILMTMVDLRVQLVVSDPTNLIRCLVVYDRQSNGSNPSTVGITNILDTVAAASQTMAPQLQPTKRRYKILLDRLFTMDLVNKYTWMLHKRIKVNRYTEYNGNAGSSADIVTGGLYLIFVSDSSAISHPTMQFTAKMFYKDT